MCNFFVRILNNKSFSAGLTFYNLNKKVVADNVPLPPCIIYNGRVALVICQNPVHVAILYNPELYRNYLAQFDYIWNKEKGL